MTLTSLWLESEATTYEEHQAQKAIFSLREYAFPRAVERSRLQSSDDADIQDMLRIERAARAARDDAQDDDELEVVLCRGSRH